jgi:Importin-beta N-terminal domain
MQAEALGALLYQLYDPACPAAQKHQAEQHLNALSNSVEGLEWAITCVQSPNMDPQQQFFAASVLEGAVARRWSQLPPTHQATLQNCLWMHVTQPSNHALPHFVISKLRAALAQLACINWQLQFWTDLQSCLNNAATAEAGVRLIGVTLEQLHSMAQGTTSALSGKVRNVLQEKDFFPHCQRQTSFSSTRNQSPDLVPLCRSYLLICLQCSLVDKKRKSCRFKCYALFYNTSSPAATAAKAILPPRCLLYRLA